jgi:hypothetical protein
MFSDLIPGRSWTEIDDTSKSTFTEWFTPFPPSCFDLQEFIKQVISACNQSTKNNISDELKIKLALCAGMLSLTYRSQDRQIVSIDKQFRPEFTSLQVAVVVHCSRFGVLPLYLKPSYY